MIRRRLAGCAARTALEKEGEPFLAAAGGPGSRCGGGGGPEPGAVAKPAGRIL